MMPGLDGFDTCRALRAMPGYEHDAGADADRARRRRVDHARLPGRRHRLLRQVAPSGACWPAACTTCCARRARASSSSAARPSWRARRTWRAWAASTGGAAEGGPACCRPRACACSASRRTDRCRPARSCCAWCPQDERRGLLRLLHDVMRAQLGAGHRRAGHAVRRPPAHHPRRGRARVQRARPRRRLHRHRAGRDRPPRRRGQDPPPRELRRADRPAEPAPADLARRARARAGAAHGPPGARCC